MNKNAHLVIDENWILIFCSINQLWIHDEVDLSFIFMRKSKQFLVNYHITGHFHFKLEKKFPQGAKKKYPCIEIIYDFSCQKYSKLRGKNVGIDLNLVL